MTRRDTIVQRAFDTMVGLTALATLVALIVRVTSTIQFGSLIANATEGPAIYTIWKIQHGYPAYEWPTRGFFALTLYNFLFYESYARILSALGIRGAWLPVAGRLLTMTVAIAGAALQYTVTLSILERRGIRPRNVLVAAFAFCTWFGLGFIGRWAVFVRPDVAACFLVLSGFAVCISVVDGRSSLRLIGASVLFYLAWAFKQSAVATFAGACVYFFAVRRSIRDTARLALPFAALTALTLAIGGEAYRYNILMAPRVGGQYGWWPSWYWYRTVLMPNLPVWVAAGIALWPAIARRNGDSPIGRDLARLFAWALGSGAIAGVFLMARSGSTNNHIFDLWVISALLASVTFFSLTASPQVAIAKRTTVEAAAAVLMALPFAYSIGLLTASDSITRIVGLGVRREPVLLGSAQEYAMRAALRDRMRTLPSPVYVDDDLLAQPWNATGDRYPAIVIDHIFYDSAHGHGLIEDGGVVGLIERRYFGTVVAFVPPFYLLRAARDAGYVEVDRLRWDDDREVVVLVRSATPPVTPDQIRRPTRRRTP